MMLPAPEELREESRLCRKVAEDAADTETQGRLGKYAFLLALLAEVGERDGRRAEDNEQIKRWRTHAEELRTIAEDLSMPSARAGFQSIADTYDRLAEDAEARLTRRSVAIGTAR